ncbi:MAG: imelysin family protein [Bacteroidia bacterium]
MKKNAILLLLPVFILSVFSCKDSDDPGTGDAFDRGPLLEQVANQRILPVFTRFEASVNALSLRLTSFSDTTDSLHLANAQLAWEQAFIDFQAIRGFTFGPGEQGLIGDVSENLGTWPVDTAKVEQRILASDLVMNDFRRDTRGFLALEYLLFEPNALGRFQGPSGNLRRNYLLAVDQDIQTWAQTQTAAWTSYLPSFIADESKAAGSSISELYNHWLQDFEGIKNFKIALPAGLRVGQTQAEPQRVESRFAHLSIRSIKVHLEHIENVWYGNAPDGSSGTGFDDYLDNIEGGPALKAATLAQWTAIHTELAKFQDAEDLAVMVMQDPQKVSALLNELQKMTRFLKSDLSSILGIAITYSSGDGD